MTPPFWRRMSSTMSSGPSGQLSAFSRVSFDLGVFAQVARQRVRRTFVYLLLLVAIVDRVVHDVDDAQAARRRRAGSSRTSTRSRPSPSATAEASADVEQPWVKRLGPDEGGRQVVAIIDTTGTREDFEPNEIGVFLKKTEVMVKTAEEERILPLSRFPDTNIGPDAVRDWIKQAMRRAPFYIGAFLIGLVPVRQDDAGDAARPGRAHRSARGLRFGRSSRSPSTRSRRR